MSLPVIAVKLDTGKTALSREERSLLELAAIEEVNRGLECSLGGSYL